MINISAKDVNFYYGSFHALKNITLGIERNTVAAFIGPSGCGKSTFLRLLNRMNDLIEGTRLNGEIRIDGEDIYGRDVEVVELRKKVGMVFQKPNPFPKTIYENVAYGLRVNGVRDRRLIDERVESSLKGAALWDEVKDKLKKSAFELSGGQQQRLCIANRGPDLRTEKGIHDRHRHAQHAAGGARQRPYRILLHGRARRVRPDPADVSEPLERGHAELRDRPVRLIRYLCAASA